MELTDKYYRQDLCKDVGRCKLYHPLFEQGQCEYYNQWCELKQENKILKKALKFAMEEKVFNEVKQAEIEDDIFYKQTVDANIEYYMALAKDEERWI